MGLPVQQFTGDRGGSRDAGRGTLEWVLEVQRRGAGEIVLICMASDGCAAGMICAIEPAQNAVRCLCGFRGAGAAEHFIDVFRAAPWMGALAGQLCSFRRVTFQP